MTNHSRITAALAFLVLAPAAVYSFLPAPALSQPPAPAAVQPDDADASEAAADLRLAHSLSRAFNRAAETIEPSVVHVTQFREVPRRRGFRIVESEPMAVGAGSGVIVTEDGYILTNNHVITGATGVKVKLSDGREFEGRIIGTDPATDLGVVKIDASGLRAAQWGDSEALYIGEWVLAVGSPFGQFDNTVTSGIVSAKNRTNLAGPRDERFEDFIQTDAAINPGNSGGPLVNLDGKVVGINSQIASRSGGNVGLGFSIPADIARPVMDMIIHNNGRVERGWLGVGMAEAEPASGRRGVLLTQVLEGGPAGEAGLLANDVVVRFNGREIDSTNRLRNAIALTPPGTAVEVELMRDGRPLTRTVRITDTMQGRSMLPGGKAITGFGFTVATLSDADARALDTHAVYVSYIAQLSPAAEAGLQLQDVILRVNSIPVGSAQDFDRAISEPNLARVRLDVYRSTTGQRGYITIVAPQAATPRAD